MTQLEVSPRVKSYRRLMKRLVDFVSTAPRTKMEAVRHLMKSGKSDREEAESAVMQALYDRLVVPVDRGSRLEVVKPYTL